jgi:hypothetical protein
MDTKKKAAVLSIMLIIAIGNYSRITNPDTIRTVEFLSIFAIGALTAALIRAVATIIKEK